MKKKFRRICSLALALMMLLQTIHPSLTYAVGENNSSTFVSSSQADNMKIYIQKIGNDNGSQTTLKNGILELEIKSLSGAFPASIEKDGLDIDSTSISIKEVSSDRTSITLAINLANAYQKIDINGQEKEAIEIIVPSDIVKGTYTIKESKAPDGFVKSEDTISLEIDPENKTIKSEGRVLYSSSSRNIGDEFSVSNMMLTEDGERIALFCLNESKIGVQGTDVQNYVKVDQSIYQLVQEPRISNNAQELEKILKKVYYYTQRTHKNELYNSSGFRSIIYYSDIVNGYTDYDSWYFRYIMEPAINYYSDSVDPRNETRGIGYSIRNDSASTKNVIYRAIEQVVQQAQYVPDSAIENIEIRYYRPKANANDSTTTTGQVYQNLVGFTTRSEDTSEQINILTMVNDKSVEVIEKTASFTITKKSTDGTILQGASFVLQGLNGSYKKELTSNSQGKVTFDNLKPGSYTLTESKAPNGYQKNSSSTSITVNSDGSISWTNGGLIENEYTSQTTSQGAYVDSFKTSPKTVVGSDAYPDYMNAISYTDVADPQSQKVTYYLMLKPNSNNGASGTNKHTRLNLEGENLNITSVKLYDVEPGNKSIVANWMRNQAFQLSYLNYNPISLSSQGDGHRYPIKYYENKYDSQLKRYVDSQIYLPSERFGSDWSFIVAVEGQVQDKNKESSITYNWFTDSNPEGEVGIWNQKTTIQALYTETSGSTGHINPSFDVVNEPNPVEVYGKLTINKKDNKENTLLGGAKFLLESINSDWSQEATTGQDGKLTFDQIPKGEYILSETQAPSGYKQSPTKWKVYVNSKGQTLISEIGDASIGDSTSTEGQSPSSSQDVSDSISITSSSMTYSDIDSSGSIDLYTDENQININLQMAVDGKVSPGDYFVIDESDTLHYNMVQYDKTTYTPIFSETGEIVATPELIVNSLENSLGKKIHYVFTDYVEGLDNLTMSLSWQHAVNPYAAKYDGDYKFELKIDDSSVSKTFNVKYQEPTVKGHVSINTVYPYVNDQIGKYTQYAYINPLKNNLSGTSTITAYTANSEEYENSADLGQGKTDIKLYKYISNDPLPDAVIYEEGKWQEVDPSTYKVSYGQMTNPDGSVQTYAEFDVNGINTDTYLLKVDSELKDTTANQAIVGQFVEVTNSGVSAYKGNAILRIVSSGQGDGNIQDSQIDIFNEKIDNPKKGNIKVLKKDENDKALAGVEFELRRKSTNELIETKTTDSNGEIVFENLDQDIYLLIETKTKEGYILHDQVEVKLAEIQEIPENNQPRDLSDQISLSINDYGTSSGSNITTVHPNSAEGLHANLTYHFPEGVKGGDYFYLQLSDEIDLEGIVRNLEKINSTLDIISSRGTVAKAQYERENKRIKYTFTSYADDYELTKADVSISTFVDRYVVKNNGYINPSFSIGQSTQSVRYYVDYEDFYHTFGELSIGAFITQLDYSDNSYTQYVYVNYPEKSYVWQTYLDIQSFSSSPETSSGYFTEDDMNNIEMWIVDAPQNDMPASWGVDESTLGQPLDKGLYINGYLTGADSNSLNSSNFGYWWTPEYEGRSIRLETDKLLDSYPGKALIIRVKGHFDQGTDLYTRSSLYQGFGYSPTSYIYHDNYSRLYGYEASSEGNITPESIPEVEVKLINKPNEIEFTKLGIGEISSDQANEQDYVILEGVEFTLQKKSEAGTFEDYTNATSNESGKISFSKLPQGEYQLIETKTNLGYKLPKDPVSSFRVGQDGKIVDLLNGSNIIYNEKEIMKIYLDKTGMIGDQLQGSIKQGLLELEIKANDGVVFPDTIVADTGEIGDRDMIISQVSSDKKSIKILINLEKAYKKVTIDGQEKEVIEVNIPEDLLSGSYTITESMAPQGYIKTDEKFVIDVNVEDRTIKWGEKYLYGTNASVNIPAENVEGEQEKIGILTIINVKAQPNLPETGGMGSLIVVAAGVGLMILAPIAYARKKHRGK